MLSPIIVDLSVTHRQQSSICSSITGSANKTRATTKHQN